MQFIEENICNNIRDGAFLKNILTFYIILSIVLNCSRTSSDMETSCSACHVNNFDV